MLVSCSDLRIRQNKLGFTVVGTTDPQVSLADNKEGLCHWAVCPHLELSGVLLRGHLRSGALAGMVLVVVVQTVSL